MGDFVRGDVVVLPFPFSDLSTSKKRPALVIAVAPPHDDLILCMITSKAEDDESAIALGAEDFVEDGLPRASRVRPTRLFTADSTIILRTAGRLTADKMEEVTAELIRIISG